jgi:signal transduction histidine kinase
MIASGDLSPTDAARNATIISEQASRMATLMRQLLDFARRGSTRRELTSLGRLVRGVLDLLTSSAGKKDVTVEMHADPELPQVAVDPAKMQQVVTNLVLNGIQATPRGGKVDVELSYLKAGDSNGMQNDMAKIVVQDTGPGIPPEHLDQLFEPFFTTKDVGEGTGLGLSIVYGIVEEHGGWIEVASPPGAGARFTLFLPLEATQ